MYVCLYWYMCPCFYRQRLLKLIQYISFVYSSFLSTSFCSILGSLRFSLCINFITCLSARRLLTNSLSSWLSENVDMFPSFVKQILKVSILVFSFRNLRVSNYFCTFFYHFNSVVNLIVTFLKVTWICSPLVN